jgi:hypothetical protein
MLDFLGIPSWIAWATGGLGIAGLIALSILAPPVFEMVANLATRLLGPVMEAFGSLLGKVVAVQGQGALEVFESGKRMLFVATMMLCTWYVTEKMVWREIRADYRLVDKHPVAKARR